MSFKQDRLENEKNDPLESSSLRYINIPIVLIALFVGFGVTYLTLRTQDTSLGLGDSRTVPSSNAANNSDSTSETKDPNDFAVLMDKGKRVYTTTCQTCHQATGAGVPNAFPPLAESEWVNGPPKQLVAIILHGLQGEIHVKGQKFQGIMPAFKGQLTSEDIAAVSTYVRNSFGNKMDLVPIEMVDQLKEETQSRTLLWNGETELKAQNWE